MSLLFLSASSIASSSVSDNWFAMSTPTRSADGSGRIGASKFGATGGGSFGRSAAGVILIGIGVAPGVTSGVGVAVGATTDGSGVDVGATTGATGVGVGTMVGVCAFAVENPRTKKPTIV